MATEGSVPTVSSETMSVDIGGKQVPVTGEPGIDLVVATKAKPFVDWAEGIGADASIHKAVVENVHIQSMDMFGPRVGFLKIKATVTVDGKTVPGIVFMRGGAVAILVVLKHEDKLYTVMVRQPRIAVGKMSLAEIPAGMLDGLGDFTGVAAKELKEETGIVINEKDLVNMTDLAYGETYPGMYPSCGGTDEFNKLFLYREEVKDAEQLNSLQGKCTGVAAEGEMIKLEIIPLDDLWKTSPDAKALGALCLHDRLIASGQIPSF
jgi:ADP-sugar diphosphatase